VAKTDLERRMERIRDQFENLRADFEDWLADTQTQMTRTSRKARRNVRAAGEELAEAGIPWWVPVAVIAVIGIGIAVANMLGAGMRGMEEGREEFTHQMAGQTPSFRPPGQA